MLLGYAVVLQSGSDEEVSCSLYSCFHDRALGVIRVPVKISEMQFARGSQASAIRAVAKIR